MREAADREYHEKEAERAAAGGATAGAGLLSGAEGARAIALHYAPRACSGSARAVASASLHARWGTCRLKGPEPVPPPVSLRGPYWRPGGVRVRRPRAASGYRRHRDHGDGQEEEGTAGKVRRSDGLPDVRSRSL